MHRRQSGTTNRWTKGYAAQAILLAATTGIGLSGAVARAADLHKANNADPLNSPTAWTEAITPGPLDVAVYDNTVTGANTAVLGADSTWGGLRIADPGGAITIDVGNTLTLGQFGLNGASATQDLTINAGLALLAATHQNWSVAAGHNITITPAITVGSRATVDFDISSGGTITLSGGTASTRLDYGVVNGGHDWAGLDASKHIAPYSSIATYTTNASSNTLGAAVSNYDITTFYSGSVGTAYRVTSNRTATGVRFDTATPDGSDWTVDIGGSTVIHSIAGPGILVGPNVTSNVIYKGTGNLRATTPLYLRNYAPGKDLIINMNLTESGSQPVIKSGPSRVIISGAASYTGGTNVEQGTLQIGNGGTSGSISATGSIVINDGGTMAFNRSDSALTVSNAISGAGAISIENTTTGLVTLSGANTYTGPTNFKGGLAQVTNLSNLGTGSALNFDGGGIQFASGGGDDLSTRTVTVLAGGATINTNGNNVTFASPIGNGGAGALTKTGNGALTLTGNQTYAGGTNVNGGVLSGSANVGTLTVNAGASVAPGADIGTMTTSALTLNSGAGLVYQFGTGNDKIIDSGALTLNGGALTLLDTNGNGFAAPNTYDLINYSGGLTGSVSSLSVANPQPGYNYTFSDTGSIIRLQISAVGVIGQWLNAAGGSWGVASNWSSNPSIPNAPGATANFTTALSNDATITLDGDRTIGAALFSSTPGNYIIAPGTAGRLIINTGSPTGTAAFSNLVGNHTILAPVVLDSNLSVSPTGGSTLTINGAISGAGAISNTAPGTLVLGNTSNSYTGGTNVTAGAVQFEALGSLGSGSVTLDGGTLRYAVGNSDDASGRLNALGVNGGSIDTNGNNVSFATGISGAGNLTKSGEGVLTFTANNTYAGNTIISGGEISASSDSQLGTTPGGATPNNIILNGGGLVANTSFNVNGNRGIGIGPASGATGGTGALAAAAGQVLTVDGIISGAGNSGSNTLTINSAAGETGTVILTNANTFTGTTLVTQGALQLNTSLALQSSTLDHEGGVIGFGNGISAATIGNLVGNNPGANLVLSNTDNNPVTLSVGGTASTTYVGNVSGPGNLTKLGNQTLTLTSANYTGNTVISGGTLLVTGGAFGSPTSLVNVAVGTTGLTLTGGSVTAQNLNIGLNGGQTNASASITGNANATFSNVTIGSSGNTGGSLSINTTGAVDLGVVTLGRDGGGTAANVNGGVVIQGGNVIATSVAAGNSGVAGRATDLNITGGALTIGNSSSSGAFQMGGGVSSAGFITQTGGSLTYLGTDGLLLNASGSATGTGVYSLSGATAVANLTGITLNAQNSGTVTSRLAVSGGATLYLGNVGLVVNSPNATVTATLGNATVGAITDFASSAPIILDGNTILKAADSTAVAHNITLSGVLSGTGGLTKTGAGVVTLSGSNTYTGLTSVNQGTLVLSNDGTNNAQTPVLTGAGADITGGKLVLDYQGNTANDPAADPVAFTAHFNPAGIRSSVNDGKHGVGWFDDTTSGKVVIDYTYLGDANNDGQVTTSDFTAMATHFNNTNLAHSIPLWVDGDFNYDGKVNALDFNAIATNFGQPPISTGALAPALGSLVPEPGSAGMIALAALSMVRRRKRQ